MKDSLFWRMAAALCIAALFCNALSLSRTEVQLAAPAFADESKEPPKKPATDERLMFHGVSEQWLFQGQNKASVSRAKVPGGWLVAVEVNRTAERGGPETTAITFYPDPKHEWDVVSLKLR